MDLRLPTRQALLDLSLLRGDEASPDILGPPGVRVKLVSLSWYLQGSGISLGIP